MTDYKTQRIACQPLLDNLIDRELADRLELYEKHRVYSILHGVDLRIASASDIVEAYRMNDEVDKNGIK